MMFLFKKQPVVVECFTPSEKVAEFAAIQKTQNFVPDWWKPLPRQIRYPDTFYDSGTMKHCAGFIAWYFNGFTLPMWSDLALLIGPESDPWHRYQYANKQSSATTHHPAQHNNTYPDSKFQHIKLEAPWQLQSKDTTQFALLDHTWSLINFKTIRAMPGIVNFKYQSAINVNLMINRTDAVQEFQIKFMEPILQILPLTERPVDMRVICDEKRFDQIKNKLARSMFSNEYTTMSKLKMRKNGSKTS